MPILIAPSILSADFSNLEFSLGQIKNADILHIDVMDGHYVPNLTFGSQIVKVAKKISKLFLEVHLMINNPDFFLQDYIKSGADRLVFHPETCPHLHRTLTETKKLGCQAGLAINPAQDINILCLESIGNMLDSVTVMSVNPGFAGQKFIENSLNKIQKLKKILEKLNLNHIKIEVDGGVNLENSNIIKKTGADILVAGSAVYSGENPEKIIENLRENS